MQVLIWFGHPSVFVDVDEILVMADDVATPSDPLAALVEQEELEEVSLDVNVSKRPHEQESSKRMVRTRVDRSTWDRRLSLNPHALAIYLEFVLAWGAALERFEKCQCEDDNVRLHYQTWVPSDGHYRWLRSPINPLSMEHRTIRHILDFLQLCSIPFKSVTKL
jgi:hypothetical protein